MGKVVIITGGCRGIGLGIAQSLAAEGCSLALTGRKDREEVAEVLASLGEHGVDVEYFKSDISISGDRESLAGQVINRFGRIDVLVNNAGIAPSERKDILEATEESFDHVLNVNLKGPYFLTQVVANAMIEDEFSNEGRCIVNITSISTTVASPTRGEYCVSKAGQSMATRLFAVRLAEYGIPVYEVRPGVIATDMTSGAREKYDTLFDEGLALQPRWGTPDDVGKAVASFVRGDFPYSTGVEILVDGGMLVDRL
ncbi:MAG: 3-ketoacyl-ACP reductase [Rhodothermales bacterium]|nr:3-ketoacyl-ACP reductase [Rhodothermales bacterium]